MCEAANYEFYVHIKLQFNISKILSIDGKNVKFLGFQNCFII